MIDDLIEYYHRELNFLRKQCRGVRRSLPQDSLAPSADAGVDRGSACRRLIEAVAFMNARLRHKIDDEFPELSDALLLTLYPHLIQPLPSLMVVRLEPGQDLDKSTIVPAARC
jgi:type VI secretion system protein ImpG